jgi:peptidoglycan/LPS O-acetylase OafA/YrhL
MTNGISRSLGETTPRHSTGDGFPSIFQEAKICAVSQKLSKTMLRHLLQRAFCYLAALSVDLHHHLVELIESSPVRSLSRFVLTIYNLHLRSMLFFLLPSFIQNTIQKPKVPRKIHKTSFLDGLRGLAALFVFFFHTVMSDAGWLLHAYGTTDTNCFMQLPFFRIVFSGTSMVHIFFVISGYVLSAKQIKLIRSGNFEKLSDSLFSSIFRRYFRLFLPSIAGLVILELTVLLDIQPGLGPGLYRRLELLVYTWRWDFPEYDLKFLWTIPIEAAGSMLLFLTIMGLSRAATAVRLTILVILMVHSLCSGHWAPCEFLAGILIAEVEATLEESDDEVSTKRKSYLYDSDMLKTMNNVFWGFSFVFGLYLAGWSKEDSPNVPVLKYLFPLTPKAYFGIGMGYDVPLCFWFVFSSILIVWSLFRIPILQRPFTTGPIQYLGDISYSIYIIHGCFPAYWRIKIADFTRYITGGGTDVTVGLIAVTMEIIIIGAVNIWVADIFMRIVDHKSVQFARWMESVCRRKI